MKSIRKMGKSRAGETLVESLLAVLVTALAVCMFLNFLAVSDRIMLKGERMEEQFSKTMSLLESMEEDQSGEELVKTRTGKVTVAVESEGILVFQDQISVQVYYSDEAASYRLDESGFQNLFSRKNYD